MKGLIAFFNSLINNEMIKKSFIVLALRVIGVFLLFFTTLYITNNFPEELVGQYDISRAILLIVGSFGLLGFNQSIIFYSGFLKAKKSLSQIKEVYIKMLTLIIGSSVTLAFIAYIVPASLIDAFYEKEVYPVFIKSILAIFFYAVTMLNIEVYRGIDKITTSEIFRNIIRHVPFLIALFYLVSLGDLTLLVDAYLISFGVLGVLSTILILIVLGNLKINEKNTTLNYHELLTRSFPMSISIASFFIMQSVDILLVGKFMDFKNVAFYATAVKLTMIISIVLSSINAVFAPKVSHLFNLNDTESLKVEIKKATRFIFILTTPILIVMLFGSSFILSLFGEGYEVASGALIILVLGQAVNALCGSTGMYMDMTGNQKVFQKIISSALIVNVILNWFLIPKYGLEGAAIATTVSTILWNITTVWFLYSKRNIKSFLH